jgi:hypothetical protein
MASWRHARFGESWTAGLRGMSDEQLDGMLREMTDETLPADDPLVDALRAWLRTLRDEAES